MSRLAGLALFSLLLAACAAPSAPGERQVPDEKQYGGVFQYASQTPPDGLYYFDLGTIGSRGRPVATSQVWNGLVNYELTDPGTDYQAAAKFVGALAESWNMPDPGTIIFNLRKGVKWHDGTEFTSKDAVWSIARWGDRGSVARLRTVAGSLEKVEAPDAHTLKLTLKRPDPEFLQDISRADFKILAAHIAEKAGNPTGEPLQRLYEQNVVGTGPFKLRTFDRQRHLETERFDEYWGGRPYLDGTRTVFGLERSATQAGFIARELDYVSLDDKVQFDTVKSVATDAVKIAYITGHNWGLQFSMVKKPFDDVRVRKAINLAVDRQKLLDSITFGEGMIPAPAPILPTLTKFGWGMPFEEALKLPGWRPQKDQDIAEAKRLLAEAGYPNGFKTIVQFRRGLSHPAAQSEAVASQLKTIGVEMEVRPTDPAFYAEQVYVRKDFEVINEGGTSEYAIAATAHSKFHSKGSANYAQVNDPELDRLIDAALNEADKDKRNQVFIQMQKIIAEKAYYAPIVTLAQFVAHQPWVHDFFPSHSVSPDLLDAARIWLDLKATPEGRRKF